MSITLNCVRAALMARISKILQQLRLFWIIESNGECDIDAAEIRVLFDGPCAEI